LSKELCTNAVSADLFIVFLEKSLAKLKEVPEVLVLNSAFSTFSSVFILLTSSSPDEDVTLAN
jgi:7-keto-8-aminopelargonate synthetase-like enzyme